MDSNQDAIKAANAAARTAKQDVDYYKGLAGMYQLVYDSQIEVSDAIMTMKGIWVEMRSDIMKHEQSKGESEHTIRAKKRLDTLMAQFERVAKVQSDSYTLKQTVTKQEKKLHLQWTEINDLKRRLQLHTDNLNNIPPKNE